jgi:predicted small secreted protein
MKALSLFVTLLGFAAFALTGCNTTKGVGEDVQAVGKGLAHSASGVQKAIKKDVR